jgi:TonB family protein
MEVPEEAKKAGLAGEIKVTLDLDENGRVQSVYIVKGLGLGTEEACKAAWKGSRWKPAEQDGTPVAVKGVPQNCLVVQTN